MVQFVHTKVYDENLLTMMGMSLKLTIIFLIVGWGNLTRLAIMIQLLSPLSS